jgi:tetratricopeptide (TPR) repeat protein/tRNA A-37 threonylcarbamoyl transferase component Bud32
MLRPRSVGTMPTTSMLARPTDRRDASLTVDLPPRAPVLARTTTTVPRPSTQPWLHIPLRPGHKIPGSRYRIVRWLGEGGMGVVYEAEHVDMQRRAAVKILRSEICNNPVVVQAFRDEARAASRIQSDLIVQLYDFVELPDERLMIAMELLSGHTLYQELARPMELSRAVGILRQVCRGLSAAHAAGVVHRDIKPENVFLTTREGRADAVKLVDFGIAAIHDGTEPTAIRGGTPYYLAPEVGVQGSVAPSVDIYAWGCMAFELLTGSVPFGGDDATEVLRAHLVEPPPTPSSRRAEIPPVLDAVVLRCLQKDPAARYPSMLEVEAALCEAQLELGLRTAWDDLTLPLIDPVRRARLAALLPKAPPVSPRRRSWVALAAGAVLLLSSGAAIEALADRGFDDQEQPGGSGWVEERGTEARDAAAKALFVYPPADEPLHATAYTVVRALEEHRGRERGAALELAAALRAELAATLVRLGDDYWNKEGGRKFAAAYYDQALLFDPGHAVARERSSLSKAELEAFARRAAVLAFAESELLGAEPLVVLAAPDAAARAGQLRALRHKRAQREAMLDDTLEQLSGLSTAPHPVRRAGGGANDTDPVETTAAPIDAEAAPLDALALASRGSEQAPVEAASAGEGTPVEAAAEPAAPLDTAPAGLAQARPDRSRARVLANDGQEAFAAGDLERAEALFEQALGQDRRHVDALAGLRDVAFERGAYPRAVKLGERAVRERPQVAEHRLHLGDAYLKVLRYRDALEQYERARALGETRADWRIDKVRKKLGLR